VKAGAALRLDGRVVDVRTHKILKSGSASGSLEQLFDVERKLALDLVGDYAAATERERTDLFAAKRPTLAALTNLSRVRMLSAEGKLKEAKEAYARLLADDPAAAERLKALQKSWSDVAATVAVAPLANVSARPEDGWLGVGIAEALATDLKKVGLFLVERQQVEKLMQERRLVEIVNDEQAVQLGKLAGASILALGSFQCQGAALRIDVRLVDVSSSQLLQTFTVEGQRDQLFEAESRLAKQVATALKVEPSQVERAALAQGKPSLEDFKRYIQASSKLVVKEAPARELRVGSLAVGAFNDAQGGVDSATADAVRAALVREGSVAVRAAASGEAQKAGADALVLGTVTRSGDRVRIDARAVAASSGEVVASATAIGSAAGVDATRQQVAQSLLASLGLRRSLDEAA
jgi:TolB-like protein